MTTHVEGREYDVVFAGYVSHNIEIHLISKTDIRLTAEELLLV